MRLDLPHCQESEECYPVECVARLIDNPNDEIYFAVSEDFYDVEDQLRYDDIYSQYHKYYDQCASRLSELLGIADFAGNFRDPKFPGWAMGDHIHVWNCNDHVIWLRLHHEDRECPILVALSIEVA